MRIDKFLKVSRIIKRRTVAKEVVDQCRVSVNDQVAKAGTKVTPGDKITIRFGNQTMTVKVNDVRETTKKDEAEQLYDIISQEKKPSDGN